MKALKSIIKIIKAIIGCHMKDLVWYASYGSNMNKKRFLCYIQSGRPKGSTKCYKGCSDKSMPRCDKQKIIPHELYFAKQSPFWGKKGVAFIKSQRSKQETLARMYLIKKDQFIEVLRQENGKDPNDDTVINNIDFEQAISKESYLIPDKNWYDFIMHLGYEGNYPIFTFTGICDYSEKELNPPGEEYIKVIIKGIKETYNYPDEKIIEYLKNLEGIKGHIDEQEITVMVKSTQLDNHICKI